MSHILDEIVYFMKWKQFYSISDLFKNFIKWISFLEIDIILYFV